jgi:hypothetical protein
MRKLKLLATSILCFTGTAVAITINYRTPLSLEDRGPIHYPLTQEDEGKYSINSWKALYYKTTDKAFIDHGSSASPLAELYFGASEFTVDKAFQNEQLFLNPNDVFAPEGILPVLTLSEATISPRVEYNEKGFIFGMDACRHFGEDNKWRVGMRACMPFKIIDGRRLDSKKDNLDSEVTWNDLFKTRFKEEVTATSGDKYDVSNTFAFNLAGLKMLSALGKLDIVWGNGVASTDSTKIDAQTISNLEAAFDYTDGRPGVAVLFDQNLPDKDIGNNAVLWADYVKTVPPAGAVNYAKLNAAGIPDVAGASRVLLENSKDYSTGLSNNLSALNKLWLVPTVYGHDNMTSGNPNEFTSQSSAIKAKVTALKNDFADIFGGNIEDFLKTKGISFDDQRTVGAGDLDLEIYGGYDFCSDLYLEGAFGLRLPIGEEISDPGKLWKFPIGNNGHFEVKAAAKTLLGFYDWMKGSVGVSYSHVCRNTERRLAGFKGATIKNIGPVVNADVHWDYCKANADFTFYHPKDRSLGTVLGYQLYYKTKDKINCDKTIIPDLMGNLSQLSPEVMSKGTNIIAHQVRGEMFKRWDSFEIVSGGSYNFAGKNCPRESDVYIGVNIYF